MTALVAAAVWTPYFLSLQSKGGYGPIAANHAKYVVGFAGWIDSAARQVANQHALGILSNLVALGLALLLPTLLESQDLRRAPWLIGKSLLTAIGLSVLTSLNAVALGAVAGIGRMALAYRRTERLDAVWSRRAVGATLVFAWLLGMTIATPLYMPYPRLVLPWWLAACIAASLNWAECVRGDELRRAGERLSTWIEPERLGRTHCCFCGQQCGIQLKVKDNEVIGFEPWEDSPSIAACCARKA